VCLSVSLSQQSSGIQGMDEFCRQLDVFVEYRFVVRQTVDVTNPPGQVSVHHRSQLTVTQFLSLLLSSFSPPLLLLPHPPLPLLAAPCSLSAPPLSV